MGTSNTVLLRGKSFNLGGVPNSIKQGAEILARAANSLE